MSHKFKLTLAVFLNVALLASPLSADLQQITFDSAEWIPWQTVGQNPASGWQLFSGNAIVSPNGEGFNGGKALKIPVNAHEETKIVKEISWNAVDSTAFIDLRVRPAANPEGSLASICANGTQIAFQVPEGSNTGEVWVYQGNDGALNPEIQPEQWIKTVGTFNVDFNSNSATEYLRITLRHDYLHNLWDLFIDGKLAAANLSFENRGENLQSIEFFGSVVGDTHLDEIAAQTENMLFPDADRDGLPDAWEIANDSNPDLYDRNNNKPGTGRSHLDHYMDSLWASGGTNGNLAAPASGGIPPLSIEAESPHQPIGALKGSFSVGSEGAASYSIPIDLPKGTGGMEPQLGLNYSSSAGNGLVGLGFNIMGLQAITRGLATYSKDGFAGALGQEEDRFYLNGERLVCIAGVYGARGSEYRTEIDSFARIILEEDADSGSSSWKVETKAGLILEFGTSSDSTVLSSTATPLSWLIKKTSDTLGNYYLINYESEISQDPKEILNHRIKEIKYTGNVAQGLEPYCMISFLYESRPDILSSYSRGSKFTTSSRVKAVQVASEGRLNHRYELSYQISTQTHRSILSQVQKFQADGQSVPPTLINWNAKADTSIRTKWYESVFSKENFLELSENFCTYSKFIDVNGDGLLDRVDHYNYVTGQYGLWVSLNTRSGFTPKTKWYTGDSAYQNLPEWHNSTNKYSGFLDINGDGLPDRVDHHNYQNNQPGIWVSLNNGSGFDAKTRWWSSSDWRQSLPQWGSESGRYSGFLDLNADGLPDKVDHHNYETNQPGIWVSLNTGSGFSEKTRWYVGGNAYQNLLEWTSDNSILSGFFDINGDGRPDRVDHYDYTTNTSGIWVSLNTGTAFAPKTKWYSSSYPSQCFPEWYSSLDRHSGFIDMNGDGLLDRVDHYDYQTSQFGLWVSLNTGHSFASKERWYNSTYAYQNIPYWSSGVAWCNGLSAKSTLSDINGDGLPDRLDHYNYATNEWGLWVSLNTGTGFADKTRWYTGSHEYQNIPRWNDGNSYSDLVDMNADGLPDRVDHHDYATGAPGLWVSLNSGSGFKPKARWYHNPTAQQNYPKWNVYSGFIDLNSDGLPDRLDHYNYQTGKYGFWVSLNKGNGYNEISNGSNNPELVSSITDGFGSEICVEYRRLNDPSPTEGFGSRVYEKSFDVLPAGHVAIIDARLVVSSYSEPDGNGGRRVRSQRYGDLRYDRNHGSSLGFGWIEAKDHLNNQITRTETRRDHPFAGSPVRSRTWVEVKTSDLSSIIPGVPVGMKCLSEETATYDQMPPQEGLAGGTVYRPVQTGSVKTLYDLNGNILSQTTTSQSNFDAFGFVKNSTVKSLDGSEVSTVNAYVHTVDENRWHLGRLSESTVVKSGAGKPTLTKTSCFTYSPANGLLITETIEPENALRVTKTYGYDDFGNIISTSATGSGMTRVSSSSYDSQGRFILSESNQLGHTVSYNYDTQRALLLSTTDINGKTTSFGYDAFGTLVRTWHPDGTQTGESTGFADGSGLPSSVTSLIANPIKYFRAKQTSGSPVGKVYLDSLGREIVVESTILRDAHASGSARYSKIYTVTCYDLLGRKVMVSEPFGAGDVPYSTRITYDFLGRVIQTTHPDGQSDDALEFSSLMLSGQPTTYSKVRNARSGILERWEDQHGRLIQSRDPSGQVTTFQHDHEGRVLSVGIDGTALLTNSFDLFGNKTNVTEVNSGNSSSTYNAFGEVTSSTNANLQTTYFAYDAIGRPRTITKPEGAYTTSYDEAPGASLGKPWKTTGPDGYQEAFAYDEFGRLCASSKTQFGETFSTSTRYDCLGRPLTATDAGGLTVVHEYDPQYSFATALRIGPGSEGAGTLLWQAGTFDSKGRAITQTLAQGVSSSATYHAASGLLATLHSRHNEASLQDKSYQWDAMGNLTSRDDAIAARGETFSYDNLNRVTGSTVAALSGSNISTIPPPATYSYATNGNLLSKPGLSNVAYNGPRPHAVTSATIKGVARNYTYDSAGYVIHDSRRAYSWTSFGQLKSLDYLSAPALHTFAGITVSAPSRVEYDFDFDASGNRARQLKQRVTVDDSRQLEETLYLGSYERELHMAKANASASPTITKTVHRHNLGGFAVYTKTEGATGVVLKLSTILKDHLGSTDLILTALWNGSTFADPEIERQSFDSWGERRAADTFVTYRNTDSDSFRTSDHDYDRGYTGHEQLDDSGLIHMNGRIYDPELGRMLSPDPIVQVPEYSQNFNRYSYVMNNPLNLTDPTGFSWISNVFHKVGNWIKENWKTVVVLVVAVVLTIVTAGIGFAVAYGAAFSLAASGVTFGTAAFLGAAAGYAAVGAIVGAVTGALGAALAGGDMGDILRGTAVGGISGALTGALHMTSGIVNIVGHGAVGGASNVAMGGKFGDGFLSAAASAATAVSGLTDPNSGTGKSLGLAGRTAIASAAGGTASALGGGKFANGAVTGAMTHLLNAEIDPNGGWNDAPPKAIPLDKQVLVFEPMGIVGYGKSSQPITGGILYWLDVGGDILEVFNIRTGGLVTEDSGKPGGSDTQVRDGLYRVSNWRSRPEKVTFTDFDLKLSYSLDVNPLKWGKRPLWQSAIRIHPDGPIKNGFCTQPGTAGCLGVANSSNSHVRFYNRASNYFSNNNSINLHVLRF